MRAANLAARLQGRKTAIKLALLDQKTVVGVGNIYVCESLHRAGISPRRDAIGLVRKTGRPPSALVELTGHIKDVIAEAIDAGGSTLNDFASVDGTLGYFTHQFAVYGREGQPCEKAGCGGVVRRIVQSNRSTFSVPLVNADHRVVNTLRSKTPEHQGSQTVNQGCPCVRRSNQGVPVRTRATRRYHRVSMVMQAHGGFAQEVHVRLEHLSQDGHEKQGRF